MIFHYFTYLLYAPSLHNSHLVVIIIGCQITKRHPCMLKHFLRCFMLLHRFNNLRYTSRLGDSDLIVGAVSRQMTKRHAGVLLQLPRVLMDLHRLKNLRYASCVGDVRAAIGVVRRQGVKVFNCVPLSLGRLFILFHFCEQFAHLLGPAHETGGEGQPEGWEGVPCEGFGEAGVCGQTQEGLERTVVLARAKGILQICKIFGAVELYFEGRELID
mmetsp:Transcript_59490/g.70903  ORF Transcript_59490/g.70903 Transcript_59490/m.70903 type:complete len:215 (+) Transcript_59490:127-771(+)